MTKCQSILLAADLTIAGEGAINVAARLADIYQAQLHVFHVFQYVPQHRYPFYVSWMVEESRKRIANKLALMREQLGGQGRNIETQIVEDGDPAQEILQYAKGLSNPFIVTGTHSSVGIERFILGSVAEDVRRNAVCPVITVGPEIRSPRTNKYSRILIPIGKVKQDGILDCASSLVDPISGRIELVHVIMPDDDSDCARQCQEAREYLRRNNVHPNAITDQTLHGTHIAQAIVNEAERFGTDLIIMSLKRASEAATHMPPGISTQVVSAAPCPVLSIPL